MASGWLDVELRHLLTFRVLAGRLSFRATATELGFAQSAISQHIATLEQRVGARLVERGHGVRTVALTPAGELLLRHVDDILARVAIAERDFAQRGRSAAAPISIGVFQSVGEAVVAPALADVQRADPSLVVELVDTLDPIDALRAGTLDLAFSEAPPETDDVVYVELLRDPYVLLVRAADPRSGDSAVPLEALAAAPLLMYRSSCHLRAVERELAARGGALRPVLLHDDGPTLHSLVIAGIGVALLPRLAVRSDDPRLRSLPVDPAIRPRVICLAWNRERDPSDRMRRLIDACRRATGAGGSTALRRLAARPAS